MNKKEFRYVARITAYVSGEVLAEDEEAAQAVIVGQLEGASVPAGWITDVLAADMEISGVTSIRLHPIPSE